jgi:hypothetical protein
MIQSSLSDGLLDADPALKNWAEFSRRYAAAAATWSPNSLPNKREPDAHWSSSPIGF